MADRVAALTSHLQSADASGGGGGQPAITTHVLDTARGCPAEGLPIVLSIAATSSSDADADDVEWKVISKGSTNSDGRCPGLLPPGPTAAGRYRLRFKTKGYHTSLKVQAFFPYADLVFDIRDGSQHYHVPLLLSPFAYSTYRGS